MRKNSAVLRLGFIPTRRGMSGEKAFNREVALKEKRAILDYIRRYPIEIVDLEGINEDGMLYDGLQTEEAARRMSAANVEALFAPHCNFGCEDAVAKVAARVNRPLLLWGPGGETVDSEGYRYRDSQCGLFATSKVLQRVGVPFSYITSCRLEDSTFQQGFANFIRAASAAKMLRHARIGQISLRPNAFWSVQVNEAELLEQFGIETVPLTLKELEAAFQQARSDTSAVQQIVKEIRSGVCGVHFPQEALERAAALEIAVKRWADENQLDAAATNCWAPMFQATGLAPCLSLSRLSDQGFPTICECDLHGAISSLLAYGAAMGDSSTFLADITIRHPSVPNRELLWHCGVFPMSMCGDAICPTLEEHYNRKAPAVNHFELKKGDVTLTRFDGVRGKYSLLIGECRVAEGPETLGTYGWMDFHDWPLWEHRLIYGPYIHHCAGTYGKYASALYEACRFIPGLIPDPVEPSEQEIQKALRGE